MTIFTPNTVIRSTEVNANFDELLTSKSTDANGWTVYDFKTSKQYRKRVTFSQTLSGAVVMTISSNNLPFGITDFSNVYVNYSYSVTGSAYALSMVMERATTGTTLVFTARSNDSTSRTYTGFIDITLVSI